MSFVRFTPVMLFYWDGLRSITPVIRSYRYVLRSITPVIRSYRYVLRSITPAVCRIAPNRTACDMLRSYSAVGRDRHSCVLGCRVVIRLCWFTSGLRVFCGDPDGIRKKRGDAENGVGGAARVRFCVIILALLCFPRGVRWGYAPQTAPRRLVSLDSLHLIRGRVRFTRRGVCVYNEDLPGSNLWPGKSGCIAIISARTNVQTRSAPKR